MRVDNGYQIFRYDGGLIYQEDKVFLLEATWQPAAPGVCISNHVARYVWFTYICRVQAMQALSSGLQAACCPKIAKARHAA